MIHAYQEIYLNNVQAALGDMVDYGVNLCGFSAESFIKLFLASSVSKKIENGEPAYLSGKSGVELVVEIVKETTGKDISIEIRDQYSRSREYWIGYAIAYYQWYSSRKFKDIFKVFSFSDLQNMYYTLHEADITKFAEIVDSRIREKNPETNLKRIRVAYGSTQSDLAKKSGVSLRSIQMYEQRKKDINKASAETIFRLAKSLGCSVEDLIEL